MKAVYLLVIACYVALLWATGFLVTRRSRSSDAYLLASRSLSVPLVSVLVAGTWIGGVSVVGMAQGAYIHGVSALWFQAGVWIAMFVTALLLHKIVEGKKTYSILDIVGGLYGRKTGQTAGLLQLVFSVWVVTMQIVGGGAILSFIMKGQVSFAQGMLLTAVVFTLYNVAGGFVATAYTNLIHIAAIILGIFLGGLYVIVNSDALGQMATRGHYFSPFGDMGIFQALGWTLINFTLGVLAQPIINTASSAASLKQGRIGIVIGNLIAIPVVVMAALCGIAAKHMFPDVPSLSALPALLDVVPPYVGVLFLLAMWAPLMSSGSPFLMGATTLAVKGYVVPLLRIENDRSVLLASRLTTLAIGLVAFLLGFFVKEILRETTWLAVFLSAIVYIVASGWAGRRISSIYALISLLGTVVIVFLSFVSGFYRVVHPVWPVTGFVFMVMVIGCLASKWTIQKEGVRETPYGQ
ncbi:MAG: Sodium/pantothenate symporter [Syntrophorhabdaceae bacterium PtaU1.Bin034]|nr:MAG: Sodium/pantothenate symporter [Syntrophorhabdaceae bacterium PtaU1.Bin034]